MKVYVVGHHGPEHNTIISIHKTRRGALKAWNKVRLQLLKEAKESLAREHDYSGWEDMYERMVKNLSCKNPEKIDNYPHETPYISEYEIED